MPKASKATASEHETVEGYEGHFEHQCEHMGYVLKGKVGFRSGDEEELFEAGDAYYVGPGHTPVLYAGTEVVEFSPSEELARTMEVVTKNMEKAGAQS
jgi:mannose-6-phosphate isomerase-like protein (cupin superfamily)